MAGADDTPRRLTVAEQMEYLLQDDYPRDTISWQSKGGKNSGEARTKRANERRALIIKIMQQLPEKDRNRLCSTRTIMKIIEEMLDQAPDARWGISEDTIRRDLDKILKKP